MATYITFADDKRYVEPRDEGSYTVGENWKYFWWNSEVEKVIKLWEAGHSLIVIANRVDSTPRDVWHLIEDLREKNMIKDRLGGWKGVGVGG